MKIAMKMLTGLIAMAFVANSALAASSAVSIEYGEPGFYGRIDLGNAPRPVLVYDRPVVVIQTERVFQPIYMHVPPGHAKNWRKHCGRYSACGRPVYFVQGGWYNDVYVPYHRKHGNKHGKGRGKG